MLMKLTGGRIFDPANGIDGESRDLWVRDGRFCVPPEDAADLAIELGGRIVMAGAIDLHSHIAGGKVNLARMLLPEDHRACVHGHYTPTVRAIGRRYAEMGYTAAFEPALVAANARHAHMEMNDIPIIDTGGYLVLGNDDLILSLLADGAGQGEVNDVVAWMLHATQTLAVKVVNPGGINAFKFNQRRLDLDEANAHYGVTPRQVLMALARAVQELGVPHPLHVHGCNLGVPGNIETTLSTIAGAEGLPLHLTHVQFHSYGTEGDRKFSSGAARLAEALRANPNISIDVGQVMFGQTVTASADTMAQHGTAGHAHPDKWVSMDIECDAGCGVVPFRYRDKSFVNALQWLIGLELFLLVDDPWRIFLTTDHPNGGPFTSYPHLIRLLMDRGFRDEQMARLHPAAVTQSILPTLGREYTLYEIATMTRAAPARILGLRDRGHVGPGAAADLVVYTDQPDREAMFGRPDMVFKDGHLIVRDGRVVQEGPGATHIVRPGYDARIERRIGRFLDERIGIKPRHFRVADHEVRGGAIVVQPCAGPGGVP